MGSVVERRLRDRQTGKTYTQRYIVFYTGKKRWSEKKQVWVPHQKWETVPPKLNTKTGARNLLRQREGEVQKGEYFDAGKMVFSELAYDWLHQEIEPRVKPQTVERYESMLQLQILPALGDIPLAKLGPKDVQGFAAKLLKGSTSIGGVKQIMSHVRGILRKGVEWELLTKNPADIRIRYPEKSRKDINPLTEEEVRKLLQHAQDHLKPKWYPLFVMAIWTGMRLGELLAAKWAYFDEENRRYQVTENLTRKGTFSNVKTRASGASVPLSPFVLGVLKEWRAKQAEGILAAGRDYQDLGLLFPTGRGTPMRHPHVTDRAFKPARQAAGIDRPVRFHDLRHTCASLMVLAGRSLQEVKEQLRHTSIKTTSDTYIHIYPKNADEAAASLDTLVWGSI